MLVRNISPASSSTTTSSMTQTTSLPKLSPFSQKDNASELMSSASGSVTTEKQTAEALSIPQATPEGTTSGEDAASSSPDKGKRKNRCSVCRKKVGLTGMPFCFSVSPYCCVHFNISISFLFHPEF